MPVLLAGKELERSAFLTMVSALKTLIIIRFHLALENLALRNSWRCSIARENVQYYVNATACSGWERSV